MNNIISKLLCVFFVSASISARAGSDPDTLVLAGTNLSKNYTRTVVKEANIEFPSILEEHKEESLDYIQKFSNNRKNYIINMYQRGKKYFPKVEAVLKKYNLPLELKVLMALESSFNANAVSSAGAVGYWQMMDEAAKEYGLRTASAKSKSKSDDRKNFSKSTLAAAKYLQDRGRNLNNDLLLVVASYNCGIGKVWSAMKKAGKANPGFWDIKKYLPSETKAYVMNFIAMNVLFLNYDKLISNKLIFASTYKEVKTSDNPARINTSVTD